MEMRYMLIFLICYLWLGLTSGIPQQTKSVTELPIHCHKEYMLREYVTTGRYLEHSMINKIESDCQTVIQDCKPSNNLEVIYGQDGKDFYFIAQSRVEDTNSCWGYALQVMDNGESYTHYANFLNKERYLQFSLKVQVGHVYTFTLISLPSTKTESISLIAPDACGNEVLGTIYNRLKSEEICLGCNSPDLKERLIVANEVCQRSTNRTKRQNLMQHLTCNQDCVFHLPAAQQTTAESSTESIKASCYFVLIALVFTKLH